LIIQISDDLAIRQIKQISRLRASGMKQTKWTIANALKVTAMRLRWRQLIIPPAPRTNVSGQAMTVWSQRRVDPTAMAILTDSERLARLVSNDDTVIFGVRYITSNRPLFPRQR